jgi:hypothetical protein
MMSFEEKAFPKFNFFDQAVLKFCVEQPEYKKLNENEKEFYYWVNYSRSNPTPFYEKVILPIVKLYPQLEGEYLTSLQTDFSETGPLPLLALNSSLIKMAKNHAEDITSHNLRPSHTGTAGDGFSDRFKKYLARGCGGENISYGGDNPIFLLTLLYLDIDTPSLGHRKALLNPDFRETGVGSSFYKNGSVFLVEDFACAQN